MKSKTNYPSDGEPCDEKSPGNDMKKAQNEQVERLEMEHRS